MLHYIYDFFFEKITSRYHERIFCFYKRNFYFYNSALLLINDFSRIRILYCYFDARLKSYLFFFHLLIIKTSPFIKNAFYNLPFIKLKPI